jgi:hypothetical protein
MFFQQQDLLPCQLQHRSHACPPIFAIETDPASVVWLNMVPLSTGRHCQSFSPFGKLLAATPETSTAQLAHARWLSDGKLHNKPSAGILEVAHQVHIELLDIAARSAAGDERGANNSGTSHADATRSRGQVCFIHCAETRSERISNEAKLHAGRR